MAGAKARMSKAATVQYGELVTELRAEADAIKARYGRRPRYAYMNPDDARGLAIVAGMTVQTCPELRPGMVVLSVELDRLARRPSGVWVGHQAHVSATP